MAKAYKCDMCENLYMQYKITPQGKHHLGGSYSDYAGLCVYSRRTPPSGVLQDVRQTYGSTTDVDVCQDCFMKLLQDLYHYLEREL